MICAKHRLSDSKAGIHEPTPQRPEIIHLKAKVADALKLLVGGQILVEHLSMNWDSATFR